MLRAAPDRRLRASDGLVVEASIVARLFRMRLLTLDATVVIVPALVTAPPSSATDGSRPRPAVRGLGAAPDRSAAVGGGLAEAVRRIHEGAEILAAARGGAGTT